MYIEKFKVMNMISDRIKHDNKQLVLIDNEDIDVETVASYFDALDRLFYIIGN